jgi:phenylacetate-coenzyme A ligase PaaK-like adenylate-forming protein
MEASMYSWLPPYVYPAYERLTGRRFWSLTQQLLALQWRSPEDLRERAEAKLRTLLCHAYDHVPHYRTLFDNAGVTPNDVRSLKTFCALPITSKRDLRANFPGGVVADNLPSQRRRFTTTSGSSGVPFEFFTAEEATASARQDILDRQHVLLSLRAGCHGGELL